jgi:hypothetical protein
MFTFKPSAHQRIIGLNPASACFTVLFPTAVCSNGQCNLKTNVHRTLRTGHGTADFFFFFFFVAEREADSLAG